jgi:hypothetical protein
MLLIRKKGTVCRDKRHNYRQEWNDFVTESTCFVPERRYFWKEINVGRKKNRIYDCGNKTNMYFCCNEKYACGAVSFAGLKV